MAQKKLPIPLIVLSTLTFVALTTFMVEWQFSPLNKAIAWYHLKTGSCVSIQECGKYTNTLLSGTTYSPNKKSSFPFLTVEEKVDEITETPKSFVTVSAEDPNFPAEMKYSFPIGQDGVYELERRSLFVESKEVARYKIIGKTLEEPVNQVTFAGQKSVELLKAEVLAQWKVLVTALQKKEAKPAEELVSFAEFATFSKTTKLSDLSYRLAPTASIAFSVGAEEETSVHIGTLSLKQKDCSVTAEISIVYLKEQRVYRFNNVYSELASMCAKAKPKPAGGLLSCANCWLAPVSKQYALLSTYSPYVVATGLNGGGYVTPDTKTALTKLFVDAKAHGISTIRVSSAYRSYATQISLFNTYVNNEKHNGLTTAQATEKANTYSAKPGHSEHQLGTTTDLMACKSPCDFYDSANTPLFAYLKANAYKFGFIISYPDGSQPYTGYVYEAWHVRYVGVSNAKELYNRGYLTKKGYYLYQYLLEKGKY